MSMKKKLSALAVAALAVAMFAQTVFAFSWTGNQTQYSNGLPPYDISISWGPDGEQLKMYDLYFLIDSNPFVGQGNSGTFTAQDISSDSNGNFQAIVVKYSGETPYLYIRGGFASYANVYPSRDILADKYGNRYAIFDLKDMIGKITDGTAPPLSTLYSFSVMCVGRHDKSTDAATGQPADPVAYNDVKCMILGISFRDPNTVNEYVPAIAADTEAPSGGSQNNNAGGAVDTSVSTDTSTVIDTSTAVDTSTATDTVTEATTEAAVTEAATDAPVIVTETADTSAAVVEISAPVDTEAAATEAAVNTAAPADTSAPAAVDKPNPQTGDDGISYITLAMFGGVAAIALTAVAAKRAKKVR